MVQTLVVAIEVGRTYNNSKSETCSCGETGAT